MNSSVSLNRVTLQATVHCLTGCAIGEVFGMVIGGALGWHPGATVAFSVALAFVFGYSLTLIPLVRSGLPARVALGLALASDTVSIAVMEAVDNGLMLIIPGAMHAGVGSRLFWISMLGAIALGGLAAFPVNRWLIARGRGHGVVHAHHGGGSGTQGGHHHRD